MSLEFEVFNATDGIPAHWDTFRTRAEAEAFISSFRARFKAQGYYLTSSRERIAPEAVELLINEV